MGTIITTLGTHITSSIDQFQLEDQGISEIGPTSAIITNGSCRHILNFNSEIRTDCYSILNSVIAANYYWPVIIHYHGNEILAITEVNIDSSHACSKVVSTAAYGYKGYKLA